MAKYCVSTHFGRLVDALASVLTLYARFADAEGVTHSIASDGHPFDHALPNNLEDGVDANVAKSTVPGVDVSGGIFQVSNDCGSFAIAHIAVTVRRHRFSVCDAGRIRHEGPGLDNVEVVV